jgi:WD40 repeat protein
LLASGSGGKNNGELFLWDSWDGKIIRIFDGRYGVIYAITWNKFGNLLVSGDSDGTLRWWEVQSGKCLAIREGHHGAVHALKMNPDGSLLASCGEDGAICVWNFERAELLQTLRRDRPYERLNITGVKGLSDAQKATLQMLGAFEDSSQLLI